MLWLADRFSGASIARYSGSCCPGYSATVAREANAPGVACRARARSCWLRVELCVEGRCSASAHAALPARDGEEMCAEMAVFRLCHCLGVQVEYGMV